MSSLMKVFDPNTTRRPVSVVYTEEACPGLLEFFSSLPYRTESTLIRTVIYDWFVSHKESGTLDAAVSEILGQAPSPVKRIAKRPVPKAVQPTKRSLRPAPTAPAASGNQLGEHQHDGSMDGTESSEHSLHSASNPNAPMHSEMANTGAVGQSDLETKDNPSAANRSLDTGQSQNRSEILASLSFLDNLP